YGQTVLMESTESFFHLTDNLYLVKTPKTAAGHKSCIEDFFDKSVLDTLLEGKKFNPAKEHEAEGEYGKTIFAEKVVRENVDTINFSSFSPLLGRIVAAINHYSSIKVGKTS